MNIDNIKAFVLLRGTNGASGVPSDLPLPAGYAELEVNKPSFCGKKCYL